MAKQSRAARLPIKILMSNGFTVFFIVIIKVLMVLKVYLFLFIVIIAIHSEPNRTSFAAILAYFNNTVLSCKAQFVVVLLILVEEVEISTTIFV